MISIIIDPTFHPHPLAIPARTLIANPIRQVEQPLDQEILAVLRHAPEPVSAWRVANVVAAALKPPSRAETRALRLRVLNRVTRLVIAGFARRVGRSFLTSA